MANERKVMARARPVSSKCIRPVFVNGDRVVIHRVFHFQWNDGMTTHIEELAYQRWDGKRIAEERFFYDPAQRVPRWESVQAERQQNIARQSDQAPIA